MLTVHSGLNSTCAIVPRVPLRFTLGCGYFVAPPLRDCFLSRGQKKIVLQFLPQKSLDLFDILRAADDERGALVQ
jgi:hypothetical protein